MTPVTLDSGEYLLVDVPEDATNFSFWFDDKDWLYYYPKGYSNSFDHRRMLLPPGDWQLIGQASSLTDEQWSGIVDRVPEYISIVLFKNYGEPVTNNYPQIIEIVNGYLSPKQSGLSLIQHNGMKPNCVILKKQK